MSAASISCFLVLVAAVSTAQTDLAVVASVPPAFKTVARGSLAGVDVSVRNVGSSPATNVRLNISLPASTTFGGFNLISVPCSAPPVGSAGAISCNYASLAAGGYAGGFRVYYNIPSTYPIDADATVIASVTSDTADPDSGNNSVALTTSVRGSADLTASIKASATVVKPLDDVTWTVHVTNRGPDPSRSVSISFIVSPPSTLVSATPSAGNCGIPNDVECSVGDIASGGGVDLTIATKAPNLQMNNWLGTAGASSDLDIDPTHDAEATAWVAVALDGQADVSIALAPLSIIQPNGSGTVRLTVRNAGPDPAASPTVDLEVPPSIVAFEQTDGPQFSCSQSLPSIVCSTANLPAGTAADFNLTFRTGPKTPFGTIAAWVTAVTTDPDQGNNSASLSLTSSRRRAAHH